MGCQLHVNFLSAERGLHIHTLRDADRAPDALLRSGNTDRASHRRPAPH